MLNETLYNRGISLNLSEVKGPVMDTLSKTDFPQQLTGKIFLSQHQAVTQLGGYSYTDAETYVI